MKDRGLFSWPSLPSRRPLAKSLGISRSEPYARVLERLVELESDASITAQLDEIASVEESQLGLILAPAQSGEPSSTALRWRP